MTIEHRDALIYMLTEAAELEHAIMCQYLYAAFSLKTSTDEGIDERQLRAITGWKKAVLGVAAEEMLHLGLVNNLLASLGAAPRVGRPNLPAAGRYYPPGIQLALVPFSERALRAIEMGFERLVERHGESWVFIGPERAQATEANFWWPDLIAVTDLASARQAIATVVEQGEGTRGHWRDAHSRFLEVLGKFLTMHREHPDFEPARPVIAASVRQPVDTEAESIVSDPITARGLDIFNVAYEVLLYLLGRFFGHGHETDEQLQTLADVSVGLMVKVIKPVGEIVTTMPAGADHPGKTAGPSFEIFYRSGYLLPHAYASWVLLHERLLELYGYLMQSIEQGAPLALGEVGDALLELAGMLEARMEGLGDRNVVVPPAWGLEAVSDD